MQQDKSQKISPAVTPFTPAGEKGRFGRDLKGKFHERQAKKKLAS